ncbi:hypothetical protein ACQEU8_04075 [Streptomyces sp. CA-250714]|uniref:hypothetical protein n=1 Tax=Streptomyces sp. CA-250714 TaxID=3240060 RepID=UPI003D94CA0F
MPTNYEPTEVPAWPAYVFVVRHDGRVGVSGPLRPTIEHPTRSSAIDAVAATARALGRPVRAEATEPDGTVWLLVIAPDGAVSELSGTPTRGKPSKKRNTPAPDANPDTDVHVAAPTRDMDAERPGPSPAPVPAAASVPVDPPTAPDSLDDAVARVDAYATAGRMDEAVALAVQADEHAAHALGLSHPDALRVREARARITALAGDPVGGVRLYRDVAERWHYQGADEQAEASAARAHTLWTQISDLDAALSVGLAMVRLRNQIPGEHGNGFAAVLDHQARLEAARNAAAPVAP